MRPRYLIALTLCTLLCAPAGAQTSTPSRTPTRAPDAAPPGPRGNVVDLRPRFTVGQEVRLNLDLAGKRTSNTPTAKPPTRRDPLDDVELSTEGDGDFTVGMTLSLKCIDADPESGYSLSMKIDTFRISGNVNGENISWDSRKQGKDDALDAAFGSIVGVTVPISMDKNGNVSDVGGGITGALGGQLGGGLGGGLFKGLFGPLSTRTSNTGEARVGDKWSNDDTMQSPLGTVKIRTDNTLKSANAAMATITTKGTFSLDPTSAQQGLRLREGKLDGETKWNTADHMIESMTMKQKVVLEKRDGQGPPATSTQSMDIKVTRTRTGR